MSPIIAAKYGGPCIKCGENIKAGSFVNWDRGRGIWHLDETDNKKLSFSMLGPSHVEVEDGRHPKPGGLPPVAHHKEEKTMGSENKIMGSNGNGDTINVSDLIRALQGMAGDVAKPPVVRAKALTDKQISFCELVALGSDGATAYTDSYNVSNPAFSGTAARRLLNQQKIRNKIAEFMSELEDMPVGFYEGVKTEVENPTDVVIPPPNKTHKSWGNLPQGRTKRGWSVRLTGKQEKFCQARANGSTIVGAFKKSGYRTVSWTERRIRREGNKLMGLQKIKDRIADLASGRAPDVEVVVAGEDSHKKPRTGTGSIYRASEVAPSPDPAELAEFVDNFVELIKAHGRLFHHAVVIRGQKAVGLPVETTVKGMEEAVGRSIETLRETLSKKLLSSGVGRVV